MTNYTSNPTALDIQELVREDRYARTLSNIARRADNLWADGYTMDRSVIAGLRYVTGPKGQEYQVNLGTALGDCCDCPAFAKYGTCKHFLAVQWRMREEAEAAAYDARDAYDPYAADEWKNFFDSRAELDAD